MLTSERDEILYSFTRRTSCSESHLKFQFTDTRIIISENLCMDFCQNSLQCVYFRCIFILQLFSSISFHQDLIL